LKSGVSGLMLRIAGLLASLFALWHMVEWSELGVIVGEISVPVLALSLLLAMVSTWLTSVRWRLLDPDLAQQMRGWDYFRYVMIGATANMFMPGALGGDAIRIAFVAKDLKSHRGVAVAAIVADRWVGLFSIILLGTIASLAAHGLEYRTELLSVLLTMDLVFILGWFIAGSRVFSAGLTRLVDRPGLPWRLLSAFFRSWQQGVEFYAAHPGRIFSALLICLPIHACWFLIVYLLAGEMGIELSFASLAMVTALSWVIVAVPVSFGGVGLREVSFVFLLSLQGIAAEQAAVLGACQSAIFLIRAVFGVPFFWFGRRDMSVTPVKRVA